jgi:hypothetical protein
MIEYTDILIAQYQYEHQDISIKYVDYVDNSAAAFVDLIGFDQYGLQWSQRHYYEHLGIDFVPDDNWVKSMLDVNKWEFDN